MPTSEKRKTTFAAVTLTIVLFFIYPQVSVVIWSWLVSTGLFTDLINKAPKTMVVLLEASSHLLPALVLGLATGVLVRHRPLIIMFLSYAGALIISSLFFGFPDNWVSYTSQALGILFLLLFTYWGSRFVRAI